MKVFIIPFLLMALLSHLSHLRLLESRQVVAPPLEETLPSIPALQFVSLDYNNLVADYYWLRSISHFGNDEMHQAGYPNLGRLLERVVYLDPYFQSSYFLAGTALTIGENANIQKALELLTFGLPYSPNNFKLPYLLGFIQYFYLNDFSKAAKYLGLAAQLPDCPKQIGPFATRLAAESAQPEIGLALVSSLLKTITDEKLRQTYLERRMLLQLEVELKQLNRAINVYKKHYQRLPKQLNELLQPGILKSIPTQDPLGGHYLLEPNGTIGTTSEARRLKLSTQFKQKIK